MNLKTGLTLSNMYNTGNYMIDGDMGDDRMSPYSRDENLIECPRCDGMCTIVVEGGEEDGEDEILICPRCNGDGYVIDEGGDHDD